MRAVLGLVLVAVVAGASHGGPIVTEATQDHAGWAAVAAASGGGVFTVDASALRPGVATLGVFVLDAAGALVTSATYTVGAAPPDGGILQARAMDGVEVDARWSDPRAPTSRADLHVTVNDRAPFPLRGNLTIVVLAAGELDAWSHQVRGGDLALRAASNGSDAFLREARDFDGAVHAERYDAGEGWRAHAVASTSLTMRERVFGVAFVSPGKVACVQSECAAAPPASRLVATSPRIQRDCGCLFAGEEAGEYAFDLSGVDASSDRFARGCAPVLGQPHCFVVAPGGDAVLVALADVRMPIATTD